MIGGSGPCPLSPRGRVNTHTVWPCNIGRRGPRQQKLQDNVGLQTNIKGNCSKFSPSTPHCNWQPEIHIRLTLYVVQHGPVILGGEGRGNNSFKTVLVCKQISKAIVGNSLNPLAIILLPNAPPPLPLAAWNSYQTHLVCCAAWPCNIGRRGPRQQQFQRQCWFTNKNQRQLLEILSIHWPSYCCLMRPPPLPLAAWKSYQTHLGCCAAWPCNMGSIFYQEVTTKRLS